MVSCPFTRSQDPDIVGDMMRFHQQRTSEPDEAESFPIYRFDTHHDLQHPTIRTSLATQLEDPGLRLAS